MKHCKKCKIYNYCRLAERATNDFMGISLANECQRYNPVNKEDEESKIKRLIALIEYEIDIAKSEVMSARNDEHIHETIYYNARKETLEEILRKVKEEWKS